MPGYENPQLTVKVNGREINDADVHFGENTGKLDDGGNPSYTYEQYQYRFNIPDDLEMCIRDRDGTVKLSGATFEIYARDGEGWSEEPVETLTITDADAGAVSGFLSADADGTEYKIVETQAPNGYTLDGSLSELEQVVTVYPYHTPDAAAGENSVNCFVFANVETDSITGLGGTIHKQIREAGDGDDETEFTDETVTASESLLVSGYTVEFKLDGYGDGNNEKPVRNLTVTDNDITLQWREQVNDGSTAVSYTHLDVYKRQMQLQEH